MTTQIAPPRKHTRWEICDRHAGWFAGESRRRIAECFVEGGPGTIHGCAGGRCRLWPGTDYYAERYCHGEAELDWPDYPRTP